MTIIKALKSFEFQKVRKRKKNRGTGYHVPRLKGRVSAMKAPAAEIKAKMKACQTAFKAGFPIAVAAAG